MADQSVWLNGFLRPSGHAAINPADRGFTLGDGLFETLRIADGTPRHLALHLARLCHGAAELGIAVPLDNAQFQTAISTLITANSLPEAVLRITLTRGTGPRGLLPPADASPTLLITTAPFTSPAPEITAVICQTTRRNEFSPLSRIKSLNYLDSIIARQEAATRGAEDAILLNSKGHVTEASAANLFILKNGNWLTPPVEDGALPGILRGRLLARNLVREAQLTPMDLFTASCFCLGNTLSLRTVTALDGNKLPTDPPATEILRTVLESPKT
jgi:branched-chain amino acid aminotransferase